MQRTLVTPPSEEPLSLAEAKAYLRVLHGHEDSLITSQIRTARKLCEDYARISMLTQTWRVVYDMPKLKERALNFSSSLIDPDDINGGIRILRGPYQSGLSIVVGNPGDTGDTVEPEYYSLQQPYILWLPAFREKYTNNNAQLTVQYVAGYESAAVLAERHPDIVEAVKITVANLYEARGLAAGNLPPQAAQIMAQYRRVL